MITRLIENDVDIYFENQDEQNFYKRIQEPKLKKWLEETYPDIIEKLEINRDEKNIICDYRL